MNLDPPAVTAFSIKKSGSVLTLIYIVFSGMATLACIYATVDVIVDGVPAVLVLTIPAFFLFGIATWSLLEDLTNKLVIEADKFVYSSSFGTWRIEFDKVKGYRSYFRDLSNRSDRSIELHPVDAKGKIISVNDEINDFGVLLDWLKMHFPNVDSLTKEEEAREIMENLAVGGNKADKIKFIRNARTASYVVNVLGVAATVSLFALELSLLNVAATILVLPLCVIVVVYFKGIVYYNNKTGSSHPYVGLALLAACFGLFGKGILMSFDLVGYASVPWLIITLIAIGMGSIILLTTKEFVKRTSMDIGNVGAIFFALWLMSLGSFFITNQILDKSLPEEIMTTVTGKETGKDGDTYYVNFEPAGEVADKQTEVDADAYRKINKGDTIVLRINTGRWGSAWYTVQTKE